MAAILLVDDEPPVLDVYAAILKEAGHRVEAAISGIHALGILDQGRALDLLITDVVMPGLHGFNLARMAKMRRPSLKVLYITGYSEAAQTMRDTGERYGKELTKPILALDLCREVKTALGGG